ncbi:hypothetical protein KAFR_0E02220 [Kazachstania africana CBS 2517]|uniref:DNA replication ATP-dependent helicase/nuclease DNA2 n=1 Tax=Kazachstania africana (strain ATCC 22294 / BCRC 22015 / CBS 2517 / CECT 1963 / NBRC 1671 / NRRL Y-8276) TaxID=1071382 RepID=H2AVH5_KAZAF|nr:hypothetical protein KAFR_0E02220 [Kazachstania africana CBS 2517]CCF58375.1 hypothetical protein KAFR_0E02220 [Kazachstania africana CBS 2517]
MPKTPERRRISTQARLIEHERNKDQKLNKKSNTSVSRRKTKYQFAPINNLNSKETVPQTILKSISVSQIRNSAGSKNTTLSPKAKKQKISDNSKTTKDIPIKSNQDTSFPKSSVEKLQGPLEEVIWKYSPNKKEVSDKSYSPKDHSDDIISTDILQNPSSTPIAATRWRTVVNFTNMKDHDHFAKSPSSTGVKVASRTKSASETDKEVFRDIDDILNDIEGDIRSKSEAVRLSTFPSSPSETTADIINAKNVAKDAQPSELLENSSEDDSLMDLLAKKDTSQGALPKGHTTTVVYKKNEGASITTRPDTDPNSKISEKPSISVPYVNKAEGNTSKMALGEVHLISHDMSNSASNNSGTTKFLLKQSGSQSDETDEEMSDASLLEDLDIFKLEQRERKSAMTEQPNKFERYQKLAHSVVARKGVVRLVVLNSVERELTNIGKQKILTCIDEYGKKSSVILRNPWVYLDFDEGDIIHIVEGKDASNKRLLSDDRDPTTNRVNDNLLVLNPDILVSATTVGKSVQCMRSSVLDNFFQDPRGEPSLPMTIGNIVHELLQSALKYRCSNTSITLEYLSECLDSLLEAYSFAIIVCDKTIEEVREEILNTHVHNILKFLHDNVKEDNYGNYVLISGARTTEPISISNVIDIEENIWSPVYGLKGFLDATVEAHVKNKKYIVPMEVKTGKSRSISYEVQGLIYTLLLNDRYEMPVDFFLMYYTRDTQMTKFPRILNSIKHLLMARNKLVTSIKHRIGVVATKERINFQLPPLLRDSYCDICVSKPTCMVLNKLIDGGEAGSSGISEEEFNTLTDHLGPNLGRYKEFFLKCNDLISKEESSLTSINQEIFMVDPKTRESLNGRCISGLMIDSIKKDRKSQLYFYKFVRKGVEDENISMLNSQINNHDMIIVSDESGHFALCQGNAVDITKNSITISTRRKLLNNKLTNYMTEQTSIKSMFDPSIDESTTIQGQNSVTFRIDKNDIHQNLSNARFNILNLFLPSIKSGDFATERETTGEIRCLKKSEGGDERMRKLLIDNEPPKFIPNNEAIPFVWDADRTDLNVDQKQAIDKVLRAQDYALILGMPGTGKTTVIAEIIKILVSNNKKILLTSYTHSAVDNILLKLLDSNISIVRLGSRRNIHPKAQHLIPDYVSLESHKTFLKLINNMSVVATTCLGIKDILFSMRQEDFDYVILDEASQVSMPIALGPIRFAEKFILVGDHYQLPPLIKNAYAKIDGGLENSLFKTLCENRPESMVELTYQYRMCGDIVKLSNFLIYNDKLKCGNDAVKNQRLKFEDLERVRRYHHLLNFDGWLYNILDPNRKVMFLNYDTNNPDIVERIENENITNIGEIEIIKQCVEGMRVSGINCENIGVMTLYRAQLRLLKKEFRNKEKFSDLEILTADQFQGRDKDCIIISMVRCNSDRNGGSLLRELRRVNVAMTRAKSKLIIVGSKKTIGSVKEINSFINMLGANGWIYELPADVFNIYKFPQEDKASTQHCARKVTIRPIDSNSRFLKDKPITKQTLEF